MSILAAGTIAFDSIETPFGAAERVLGGSATYIALSARHLCDDVRLMGVVGGDFPQKYLDTFREQDIDIRGVEMVEEGNTFAWSGRYHYDMNERDTLDTKLGVVAQFDPHVPEAYRDSRIVCLGNLDPGHQLRVLEQMNAPEYVICDTMNFWIQNTPDKLRKTLKQVDCLVINDAEARELADEPNLIRASHLIRQMGPDTLIIKKGEHGALLFAEDLIFSAPAFPLEDIEDPTGAGDSFAGGFAGQILREGNLSDRTLKCGVVYGSAIASFTVERFGPDRLLDLTQAELVERARAFRELSLIPKMKPVVNA